MRGRKRFVGQEMVLIEGTIYNTSTGNNFLWLTLPESLGSLAYLYERFVALIKELLTGRDIVFTFT